MNIDVVLANSVKLQCHISEIAQVALPLAWILVRYMCLYACRRIGMLLHFHQNKSGHKINSNRSRCSFPLGVIKRMLKKNLLVLQVQGVHIDTAHEPCLPAYPHRGALLHSLKPKDPVAMESGGHGPKAMSTEYHTRFIKQQFRNGGGLVCVCMCMCVHVCYTVCVSRMHSKPLIWSSRMKQARG